VVAIGAIISCFGALNGWILLQGQLPMAAAMDKLFPVGFKKVSKKGIPFLGLFISSTLASILVSMNYTKGLVQMFSFFIMLATLTCLIPYLISSLVEVMLYLKNKRQFHRRQLHGAYLVSIPAFVYSLWAITGLGYKLIFWGVILLLAGVPVFLILRFRYKKD
jgi:APA family basic amino acid/polyamine antiporter